MGSIPMCGTGEIMDNLDELVQQEYALLDERISNVTSVSQDISNLFKDSFHVKTILDLSQEFYNRQDYVNAYSSLLKALSYLIQINQQILEKYDMYINTFKESNGS